MQQGDEHHISILALCLTILGGFLGMGCSTKGIQQEADLFNKQAYDFHYRNLDSTEVYAKKAFTLSVDYPAGRAEALNNMAFVQMARMEYAKAEETLEKISTLTNNQVELLVAEVQMMRLCQRQSRNREFYKYMKSTDDRLHRISEEKESLSEHLLERLYYAESERSIVISTYYYYLGLNAQSAAMLLRAEELTSTREDVQFIGYLYEVGSGGIVNEVGRRETIQQEFDYLLRCLILARRGGYVYWEANALQAISEHLQNTDERTMLLTDNMPALKFINSGNLPDEDIPIHLAQRSLKLFSDYGDVYQTAGAYRTIAQCQWEQHRYTEAIAELNNALTRNKAIGQALDLVASIREQLSLAYAAVGDKQQSDYNRNVYLDMQELTRQDRQLEARAEELRKSSTRLNTMIILVLSAITITIFLLGVFTRLRRKSDRQFSIDNLLQPLNEWTGMNDLRLQAMSEQMEQVTEETAMMMHNTATNRQRNLEQRAKVAYAAAIMPLIDRMKHETTRLLASDEPSDIRQERMNYISELAEQINRHNQFLTEWIQLRQGELNMKIESFPVQDLFNTLARGRTTYQMKGLQLEIEPTDAIVKADRTLTLFMLNTMAENARKFTPEGGQITINARTEADYVELSVTDTGAGIEEEELKNIFNGHHSTSGSTGFGLLNCKGIIEKYRKISRLFNPCTIGVESRKGQGSRFFFRLPKGGLRQLLMIGVLSLSSMMPCMADGLLQSASDYADSVYYDNVSGDYQSTLHHARICLDMLNSHSLSRYGTTVPLLSLTDTGQEAAELVWWRDSLDSDYDVILDVRNEIAVAALALHEWDLYYYNNNVYTKLFRERSADPSLANYVKAMQLSEANKNVAIVLLVILLLLVLPGYYLLYYRHALNQRSLVGKIQSINTILLSDKTSRSKLEDIRRVWAERHTSNEEMEQLFRNIEASLQKAIDAEEVEDRNLQEATDLLNKARFEDERLHIDNAVLDNCLSTLKHETMYYPSRVKALVTSPDPAMPAISGLLNYYQELYSLLILQAMRQIRTPLHIDGEMMHYLMALLTRLNGGKKPVLLDSVPLSVDDRGSRLPLIRLTMQMDQVVTDDRQAALLFTSETPSADYLLCRQIIREMGEETNSRGCGIEAARTGSDAPHPLVIMLTITNKSWNSLK